MRKIKCSAAMRLGLAALAISLGSQLCEAGKDDGVGPKQSAQKKVVNGSSNKKPRGYAAKVASWQGAPVRDLVFAWGPPTSASATPTYSVKQTTPTTVSPPAYMGGQAVGGSPTQGQSNIGVNHAASKRKLRPVHAIIIGAAIALACLIFVDELKLRSDVEIAGGRPSGQVIEVDLARGSGVHQLEARVNSAVDVQFLLDSGASDVTLPEEVVKELLSQGALSRSDFLGEGEYTLANGDVVTAARFMLRSITIGDLTVSNVIGSTSPSGSPALLGQSFLRKFTSWNVDNTRNKLVLQPPK